MLYVSLFVIPAEAGIHASDLKAWIIRLRG